MMKYRASQYAEALFEALEEKKPGERAGIIRSFVRMMFRHRVIGKSRAILAAYEKLVLREQGMRKVRIESPGRISDQLKKDIREILGAKIHWEEKENPDLLAGVRILVDDELLIDASAKRHVGRMLKKSRD